MYSRDEMYVCDYLEDTSVAERKVYNAPRISSRFPRENVNAEDSSRDILFVQCDLLDCQVARRTDRAIVEFESLSRKTAGLRFAREQEAGSCENARLAAVRFRAIVACIFRGQHGEVFVSF